MKKRIQVPGQVPRQAKSAPAEAAPIAAVYSRYAGQGIDVIVLDLAARLDAIQKRMDATSTIDSQQGRWLKGLDERLAAVEAGRTVALRNIKVIAQTVSGLVELPVDGVQQRSDGYTEIRVSCLRFDPHSSLRQESGPQDPPTRT
jgi:hypothetical protein